MKIAPRLYPARSEVVAVVSPAGTLSLGHIIDYGLDARNHHALRLDLLGLGGELVSVSLSML